MSGTRARSFSITVKVFTATALVVATVLAVAIVITSLVARSSAEHALDQRLDNTARVTQQNITAENAKLAAGAAAAAQNIAMTAAIITGDPATVLNQAEEFQEILGAAYTLVTDNQGVVKARTDRPTVGDSLGGSPLIGQALEGNQIAGYVNQADTRLYLAVSTPLKDLGTGVVQGVLLAADQVTDSLADEIRQASGSEIIFYVLDENDRPVVVASSFPKSPELDSAARGAVTPEMAASSSTRNRAQFVFGGNELVGFNVPLTNPGVDRPMGGYLVLRSRAQELAAFRRIQRTLYAVAGLGLLLALAASYFVARQIAKPVKLLVEATRRVAEGDYSAAVPSGGSDEIGQLASSFKHMVAELQAKQQLVDFLSGSAGSAATQPLYTAGGNVATPTMVRSMAGGGTGMLAVGQTFAGRYDVKSVLGMGGMGVVYRAIDTQLGEPVAIKTLKDDAMANDPALLQRFKDEIRLARKITHRNVVRTHDIGEVEGMYYITMEFVEGQSLKHLIQSRGKLPVNVVLTIGKQLCRALEVAHEQEVIHRDIKPQNIIVDPTGTLKVMDFGIARLVTRKEGVTQAGMAIGTPEYMAPEQLLGDAVDYRADIYAAGCVLFECLTGRTPFVADSPITLVAKQLEETPVSPASLNSEVPEPLAQLILRALSKDPNMRPASASAFHDELDVVSQRGQTQGFAVTVS